MKLAFPIAMIALNLAACAVYSWDLDWRRALYWAACAVIAVVVTF